MYMYMIVVTFFRINSYPLVCHHLWIRITSTLLYPSWIFFNQWSSCNWGSEPFLYKINMFICTWFEVGHLWIWFYLKSVLLYSCLYPTLIDTWVHHLGRLTWSSYSCTHITLLVYNTDNVITIQLDIHWLNLVKGITTNYLLKNFVLNYILNTCF